MKLFDIFKKKSKVPLYKTEDSYKEILYGSDGYTEVLYNRTNLKAPNYVLSRDGNIKLKYLRALGDHNPKGTRVQGGREFVYQEPQDFVKNKSEVIKFYWDNNFEDCNKRYSSYEEFFAVSCSGMNKLRIKVINV